MSDKAALMRYISGIWLAVLLVGCGHHHDTEEVDESHENVWTQTSEKGLFTVSLDPQDEDDIDLNEFLEWVVTIETAEGEPVTPARVTVGGGMPAHGHGLPSQPQISASGDDDGKYLLKGLMFSMQGMWAIDLNIQSESLADQVSFDLQLGY